MKIGKIRKRNAATCEKKLSRTYDLLSRTYDLLSRTYDLLSRTYDIIFYHTWLQYASVEKDKKFPLIFYFLFYFGVCVTGEGGVHNNKKKSWMSFLGHPKHFLVYYRSSLACLSLYALACLAQGQADGENEDRRSLYENPGAVRLRNPA